MPITKLTIKNLLEFCASEYKNRPALSLVNGNPISYKEFADKVYQVSELLHKLNITKGDRVAILSENSPNWAIAYFAITTMGAIAVPLLTEFHPDQINHILRHSASKAIFVSEKLYDKLESEETKPAITYILIDNFKKIAPHTKKDKLFDLINESSKELTKLKNAAFRLSGKITTAVNEDDLASIVYTSGTTGHSKGVMLSHKNIVSNTLTSSEIQPITVNDVMLSILPLPHTYECTVGLMVGLNGGACIYYFEKPPTPRLLLEAFAKIRPTIILSVPLIIEKIYKNRILPQFTKNSFIKKLYSSETIRKKLHRIAGKKLYKSFGGRLVFFGIGGAKLSAEVEQFLLDAKFPYAIGYGLTETAPLIAGCNPSHTRLQSTGPAAPGVQLKIASSDPYTQEGEILAKGPNVMKGYYNDPDLTAKVFTKDGWFRTGDLGVFDKDDYLYIKGRLKNVIIGPSGENIYPEEIEATINSCNYVLESVVYQDNEKLAARVHLNYEALDQNIHHTSEMEMKKYIQDLLKNIRNEVNNKLAVFARLHKIIEQTEPFEKTPTQKIKRFLYVN